MPTLERVRIGGGKSFYSRLLAFPSVLLGRLGANLRRAGVFFNTANINSPMRNTFVACSCLRDNLLLSQLAAFSQLHTRGRP